MNASREPGQMEGSFEIAQVESGDIVFVYSRSLGLWGEFKSLVNTYGQRALAAVRKEERISLSQRIPKFSHVMLGMDSGLVIHADGKTVSIEIISDALHYATDEASLFEIYRLHDLSREIAEKIVVAATRYLTKRYSFAAYFSRSERDKSLPKEDTTQFCSRLVAHAYRSAGIPLNELPDKKVLPVDLYRVCRSGDWIDMSKKFIQEPLPPELDQAMGTFEIPGQGELTFSEFLRHGDELMRKMAELTKQGHESRYSITRHMLHVEGILAKFCCVQLDQVKLLRIAPENLEDTFALRIVRVLQQLGTLLGMSLLSNMEEVIKDSMINAVEGRGDVSLYAGFPTPLAIREMQKARETLTVYAYLLLAEVGLLSILAHYTPHEKFEQFRAVNQEYVGQFLAAVDPVDDLTRYKDNQELFKWVGDYDDRVMSRKIVQNIVASLQGIEILRNPKGGMAS